MKYKSRAAQLYREKLHSEAAKALRIHGNKLFIDTGYFFQKGTKQTKSHESKGDYSKNKENKKSDSESKEKLQIKGKKHAKSDVEDSKSIDKKMGMSVWICMNECF